MSLAEFLAWETLQDEKHEFADGTILAFAGATNRHVLITTALIVLTSEAVGKRCRVFGSDAKVVTKTSSRYPDVVICCGPPEAPDATFVSSPSVIVEVLSESTHVIDRGEKFDEYRTIDSLQEYVLVDSRKRWVQTVVRTADRWTVSLPTVQGQLRIESLGIDLNLDEIYSDTEL